MVVLVELLPEVRTGTLHALEVKGVLLSLFPDGMVVVECHESSHFNAVPEEHTRLLTDQADGKATVVHLFTN